MLPVRNITLASKEDNRNLPNPPLPLPLLPSLDSVLQTIIYDAFYYAIDASANDARAVVKGALLHLRGQLQGPWLPEHARVRSAILTTIANPSESVYLAEALLDEKKEGPRDAR